MSLDAVKSIVFVCITLFGFKVLESHLVKLRHNLADILTNKASQIKAVKRMF